MKRIMTLLTLLCMLFSLALAEDLPATGMPDPSAFSEYLGKWYCIGIIEDGEILPPADHRMGIVLTLNDDGTSILNVMDEIARLHWSVSGDGIVLDDRRVMLQEDGTLLVDELVFSRERAILLPLKTDVRYVCVGAETGGIKLTAEQLGAEYALTLHENGKAELVLWGMKMLGACTWNPLTITDENGEEQPVIGIDYYDIKLIAIPTENGFTMDYLGVMQMDFEPEDAA